MHVYVCAQLWYACLTACNPLHANLTPLHSVDPTAANLSSCCEQIPLFTNARPDGCTLLLRHAHALALPCCPWLAVSCSPWWARPCSLTNMCMLSPAAWLLYVPRLTTMCATPDYYVCPCSLTNMRMLSPAAWLTCACSPLQPDSYVCHAWLLCVPLQPDYYVCHAWGGDFLEMLETVTDRWGPCHLCHLHWCIWFHGAAGDMLEMVRGTWGLYCRARCHWILARTRRW